MNADSSHHEASANESDAARYHWVIARMTMDELHALALFVEVQGQTHTEMMDTFIDARIKDQP